MFEFRLPDLGEGIHEGELLKWHVAEGDRINEDDPLCDMETDKAAVTIPSPRTGIVAALRAAPGDTVNVGEVFAVIDDGSVEEAVGSPPQDATPSAPLAPEEETVDTGALKRVIAAPATRRLAREMGIDIRRVTGTGPGGRITPEDLARHDGQPAAADAAAAKTPPAGKSVDDFLGDRAIPFFEMPATVDADGPVKRIPIRSLRKKTAVKMTTASILVPHVAHMDEIDVTPIEELRKEYNARNGESGKLTLMAFVAKAVAAGLKQFPMFNASVDTEAGEIVHKLFYNIGFAADTPRGLMVPVIHDTHRRSLAETGMRIRYLTEKARAGEIEIQELTGGTFTITNVGAVGGTHVFPIINIPETAILGLGRVEEKPVVRAGEIVIRKMLPVTLCFDHRAADGAQAATFVREIKTMLEDRLEFMVRI
ncbi:MAG: 2-oxo acid dehydrogenase subunit E2 [Desulfobacter sp.]|nr:MAG: 2-oxo acid dehydrogenase subunit E2 [Desulfobacter sp.]